jgi:hypothetical protein
MALGVYRRLQAGIILGVMLLLAEQRVGMEEKKRRKASSAAFEYY